LLTSLKLNYGKHHNSDTTAFYAMTLCVRTEKCCFKGTTVILHEKWQLTS